MTWLYETSGLVSLMRRTPIWNAKGNAVLMLTKWKVSLGLIWAFWQRWNHLVRTLQASQLIASGGAGPAPRATRRSHSFFLAAFQYRKGIRNFETTPSKMQIGSPMLSQLPGLFLQICAVFTIKMNNCHSVANFFCTDTPRCQDIHSKLMGWERDAV